MSLQRRLAYKDKWVYEIEQTINDPVELGVIPFPDQTTQLTLTIPLSQAQYTKILSALIVGTELAYPYESQQIVNDFLKMTEGGAMSCEDVADCIESNEATLNAILSQLANNGFSQSIENTPASEIGQIPASMADVSMLADGYDCSSPEHNMAIARYIVRELHESLIDAFEAIELATNVVEAANIATDGTPILGTLNNVTEMADWLLETAVELYTASYTQAVEDDLACEIFCHLESTCSLSLNELIDVYEGAGGQIPTDMSSLQTAMTELVDIPLVSGILTVGTLHCWVLWMLRFGGEAFGIKGWKALEYGIRNAATLIDVSYEDCDCFSETPTAQWAMYMNFAVSQYGTQQVGVLGRYAGNAGWRSVEGANPAHIQIYTNFGASYVYKAAGVRTLARGFAGAAGDAIRYAAWSGANATGTEGGIMSATGINTSWNVNNHEDARLNLLNVFSGQSFKFNLQNVGASVYGENFIQYNEAVIWGAAGAGSTKPPGSKWMPALPATTGEIFSLLGV